MSLTGLARGWLFWSDLQATRRRTGGTNCKLRQNCYVLLLQIWLDVNKLVRKQLTGKFVLYLYFAHSNHMHFVDYIYVALGVPPYLLHLGIKVYPVNSLAVDEATRFVGSVLCTAIIFTLKILIFQELFVFASKK